MSFRISMLPIVDSVRRIAGPDAFDIRLNQVTVRTRTWSGNVVGLGVSSDSDLVLPQRYPVREVTAQDISSSAGKYEVGDVLVDHITPSNGAGVGFSRDQLDPVVTTDNVEIIHLLTGTHAGEYHLIDLRNYRSFTTQMVLRRRGTTP